MATTTFSMRMDEGLKKALEDQAALENRSASYIAHRAIEDWARRQEAVRQSVIEAVEKDDGRRISGEAVMAWMQRWADGQDEPFPEPDIFETPENLRKSA
jgi:predicted transcriptional regulator